MIIETKFSLNEKVYFIERTIKTVFKKCPACDGEGKVSFKDKVSRKCPLCYGDKGSHENVGLSWHVAEELTIGQVRYETTSIEQDGMFCNVGHYNPSKTTHKVEYMAYETGIGSGTVWKEEELFKTKEEAQQEADKRNKEKE